MIQFKIDLGQILILTLIAAISWFIKREITTVHDKMDRLEDNFSERINIQAEKIFDLAGNVQKIIGMIQTNGRNK